MIISGFIRGGLTLRLELPEPARHVLDIFQLLSVSSGVIFLLEGVPDGCEKLLNAALLVGFVTRVKTYDVQVVLYRRYVFLVIFLSEGGLHGLEPQFQGTCRRFLIWCR